MPPHGGLRSSLGEASGADQSEGGTSDFVGASAAGYALRRICRLVAYGARLESVLG